MSESCQVLSIPCNDKVGCYNLNDICNGVAECLDGTDELRCGLSTKTSPLPPVSTICSSATCTDYHGVKLCLSDQDLCDGVEQCKNGFDELNCPALDPGGGPGDSYFENPYVLATVVSLAAVLVIILLMCAVYKFCVYRYSSSRAGTGDHHHQFNSYYYYSTIFLKKNNHAASDTRIDLDTLEKSSELSELGPSAREQCVQYPSQDEEGEEEGEGHQSNHSDSQFFTITI